MRRTTWTYITNIPPQHLEWNRRKHLICKEISRYNPSILCLQASSEVYSILVTVLVLQHAIFVSY